MLTSLFVQKLPLIVYIITVRFIIATRDAENVYSRQLTASVRPPNATHQMRVQTVLSGKVIVPYMNTVLASCNENCPTISSLHTASHVLHALSVQVCTPV